MANRIHDNDVIVIEYLQIKKYIIIGYEQHSKYKYREVERESVTITLYIK